MIIIAPNKAITQKIVKLLTKKSQVSNDRHT